MSIIFAICLFFVGHCADRGVWITRLDIGVIVCNGMMWNKHEHQQWYNRQHQLHTKSDYHRLYQFIDVLAHIRPYITGYGGYPYYGGYYYQHHHHKYV